MMGISALLGLALTGLALPGVAGFTFNTSVPTQCGEFTVQWDGGSPPFHLVIVPAETIEAGRILNISIPADVSAPYSYTFNLNEPAGLDFLATMYDAEGWGTGGTTPVLTVGSSDNSSCLSTDLTYGFFFYTDPTTPTQCQPMTVTWPNNVTLPVSLYGLIPGGSAFELPAPQSLSDTSYDWTVNVAQGTDVLLLMADGSEAQTGGSTPLLEVGQGSTGCMNDTSPSAGGSGSGSGTATSAGPSASVSGVGGTSGGGSGGGSGQGNTGEGDNGGTGGDGGGSTPIGAIVGGAVGGVAFIVLLALLLFFCLRRRSRERRGSSDSSLLKNYGMSQPSAGEEKRGRFDILAAAGGKRRNNDGGLGRSGSDAETRVGGEEYQPSPFRYPSPPPGSESAGASRPAPGSFPAGMMTGAAAKEAESRPSYDSDHTGTTGPRNTTTHGPSSGTYSNSQTGNTDQATMGHGAGAGAGAGVQRGASTRKTMVPPSPTVNSSRRGVEEAGPDVGVPVDDIARFVQHQDEGPVVDLPPRYDQLRTRNPDA